MSEIRIDLTKIKTHAFNILVKLDDFYQKANQELVFFWRKIIPTGQTGLLGWVCRFLRTILDNPATALFLNTLLLHFGGNILGAIFSENVLYWVRLIVALNIIIFCAGILGWKDKLKN